MKGKVFLVGAGPGDFDLITIKGLDCIRKADVIVFDRLANDKLLKEAKRNCELIYVGKELSNHTKTQDEINEIIAQKAIEGKIVTRLKGGDPYVFGRGGEEAIYLFDRNIDFEVVPGISSSIGGLCYAGIPITHRDYASSFHVITGHLKEENKELNWKALSDLKGTLVFLMGMSNLDKICSNLIKEGKNKNTPAAVVNWASRPNQRVVTGTLENIYQIVQKKGIKNPSLIIVGDVVKLRDKLNFYENKPLFGKNIVVTRSREQSSELSSNIYKLGGNSIEFPVIKINKIENSNEFNSIARKLNKYTFIIFTSKNAVDIFFEKLYQIGMDSRKLGNSKIVAIGSATAKAAKKYGIIPDIMPDKYIAEQIVDTLKPQLTKEDKILIPRAKDARKSIVQQLSDICEVDEVKIYETIKDNSKKEDIINYLEESKIDYITFTSSSTVKNFFDILGKENIEKIKDAKMLSIGPVTSSTIEMLGMKVYKEAQTYTIDGLMDIIINDIKR